MWRAFYLAVISRSYFTPIDGELIFAANAEIPMADPNDTVPVTANLSKDLFDALVELANQRGVSANTVLQQAIATEKYLSDKESERCISIDRGKEQDF